MSWGRGRGGRVGEIDKWYKVMRAIDVYALLMIQLHFDVQLTWCRYNR